MDEFPPTKKISIEDAFKLLNIRYNELSEVIYEFVVLIKEYDSFEYIYSFYLVLHKYLYKGILSNAGKFRNIKDRDGGIIGFGGLSNREAGKLVFVGSSPSNIQDDMILSIEQYLASDEDPIYAGLELYRQVIKIHPFYDANGRLSRLLLKLIANTQGKDILWREMESGSGKNKFINLINKCHKRVGQHNYKEYFNRFYKFFCQYVIEISEEVS